MAKDKIIKTLEFIPSIFYCVFLFYFIMSSNSLWMVFFVYMFNHHSLWCYKYAKGD